MELKSAQPASGWIPATYLTKIRTAHAKGRELLIKSGVDPQEIEPIDVAEAVEAHRWAWKPRGQIRLLLVAESHVYTHATELIEYRPPANLETPSQYVRLIYCLAYGERTLARFSGGTPQFWRIFGSLVGTEPKYKHQAVRGWRLAEKIRTLKLLQDRGVWLVDSCLHAISLRRTKRRTTNSEIVKTLMQQWWDEYGHAIVEQERPERIVAIGKGVFEAIGTQVPFDHWIYQPQGIRSPESKRWNDEYLRQVQSWLTPSGT